jgi:hypothetical protein
VKQQLESQQRKNELLEQNSLRLQQLLEQYQDRYFKEKEEMVEKCQKR